MSNMTGSIDAPTEMRTLTIRVGTPKSAFDALDKRFAALDAGDRPELLFELVLQREKDLQRLLNPRTIRLVRTIARQEPSSIRETARLVERDVHQVHDDLHELEQMNLVDFEQEGRAKRPTVWYDDVEIELPVSNQSG
jgi:predicted transcriptional regulator